MNSSFYFMPMEAEEIVSWYVSEGQRATYESLLSFHHV